MKMFLMLILNFGCFQGQDVVSKEPVKWKTNEKVKDLKSLLSPTEYNITQENGTEAPFKNKYWNHKEPGIYVDVVSGEPLFSSLDKYKSGTGWPSFHKPIDKTLIVNKDDYKIGIKRTEIRSKSGNSHLGHVFNDGPSETGKRFCINSASLRFVHVDDLEKDGYGEYKKLFDKKDKVMKEALLAGGCFWGMEKYLRKLDGVKDTEVGYIGGDKETAMYSQVKTGATGHAEAIKVTYDSSKLSYEELIRYFFRIHDPTTLNQQGNDKGTQYRSAIFTKNEEEILIIKDLITKIDNSKAYSSKIVTKIEKTEDWTDAEDFHQDYLLKNPNGYNCHLLRSDFNF